MTWHRLGQSPRLGDRDSGVRACGRSPGGPAGARPEGANPASPNAPDRQARYPKHGPAARERRRVKGGERLQTSPARQSRDGRRHAAPAPTGVGLPAPSSSMPGDNREGKRWLTVRRVQVQ